MHALSHCPYGAVRAVDDEEAAILRIAWIGVCIVVRAPVDTPRTTGPRTAISFLVLGEHERIKLDDVAISCEQLQQAGRLILLRSAAAAKSTASSVPRVIVLRSSPNVDTRNLVEVQGSTGEDINLELRALLMARRVHQAARIDA